MSFFQQEYTFADLVAARELGLSGWAKKKKDVSEVFISKCVEHSPYKIVDSEAVLPLTNGGRAKSCFSYKDESGKTRHVICHYYSTSGSVMSDLVKKIEGICLSDQKDQWVLITDGAGWLKRDKDLRRLISLAEENDFRVFNFDMWSTQVTSLKKRTL